ncbi:MAG: DUF1858 domain-containing protein [bacterium]
MADRVDIAPETRLADLLESWPALEDELIRIAPPFAKLRNPVLRRTIARVTTLRQAAGVGGVPLPELIARLRQAAGLQELAVDAGPGVRSEGLPSWLDAVTVVERYDAREDIEAGRHPVGAVLARLKTLDQGEAYELVTGFEPTPLIDKARDQGARAWVRREADGLFVTTFAAAPD